ncbi:MAG: hypothetical protein MUF24_05630 [Chitinophagaceae bacterium]|jgi:hypothetical protein|nr:hypothetical protein [Chitinophagaceae bacterium]
MQKLKLWLLLAAVAPTVIALSQPYFIPNRMPVSANLFSPNAPGELQANFFVWLPGNKRIWFDLQQVGHLEKLPNLDSLFDATGALLEPLLDSLAADGNVHRIDVDLMHKPALFRITTHMQPGIYTSVGDALSKVKVDQDTIRIKVLGGGALYSYVTLLLNNAVDILSLQDNIGTDALALVKGAVNKHYTSNAAVNTKFKYYAALSLQTGKLISPASYKSIRTGSRYISIIAKPTAGFAKGNFLTGISAGFRYNYGNHPGYDWGSEMSFGLQWEPTFAFGRDASGKTTMDRNDFLTLRFQEVDYRSLAGFRFFSTMSIGYLIRRQGLLFEQNTIKLGLPGLRNGKFSIEPELYFHDFLKQVSPGIRLGLNIIQ